MQKKISSQQRYEARIFTVSKDMIEDSQGRQFPYDIVHHHGGVGILAKRGDDILLVKQYRPAVDQFLIEIPAGKLEFQEDPYTAGLRELEEETSYTTSSLEKICCMYSTPGFCNEMLHIYQTSDLIPVEHPKAMDEDEEIELLWINVQQAYAMIQQGEIIDAKTIIAIQHALLDK